MRRKCTKASVNGNESIVQLLLSNGGENTLCLKSGVLSYLVMMQKIMNAQNLKKVPI